MSVAGPFAPRHPQAWPLAAGAGAGGRDDDDDPAFPVCRLKSTHEADLEQISVEELMFACEPCLLTFASTESAKAHHGNHRDVFLTLRIDPRYRQVLVETFTLAQAAAAVRGAQQGP